MFKLGLLLVVSKQESMQNLIEKIQNANFNRNYFSICNIIMYDTIVQNTKLFPICTIVHTLFDKNSIDKFVHNFF